MDVEKLDPYRWRLARTGGMRVDGLIYSSDALIGSVLSDKAVEQVANVAHLPGIVGKSLAMPDVHWGYGFPIGGTAATDMDGGVVSPGGIGYDISCLPGDASVLHSLGYTRPIGAMAATWKEERPLVIDLKRETPTAADLSLFLRKSPDTPLLRITTRCGSRVEGTVDHPFMTPNGMIPLEEIRAGDKVALYPFEGVPYQAPSKDILVSEDDMRRFLRSLGKTNRGHALDQIVSELNRRKFFPLRCNDQRLPYLIKLMGYLFGDGTVFFLGGSGKGRACFYGEKTAMEEIVEDVDRAGFGRPAIHSRLRACRIRTFHGTYSFDHDESSCSVNNTGFAALLACLGCPVGNKSNQTYGLPRWLEPAPMWHKRLFLSALFGAELSAPKALSRQNFYSPMLSMSKREDLMPDARAFLEGVGRWLKEFGVRVWGVRDVNDPIRRRDGTISRRTRLQVSSDPESLVALYSRVGFSYHCRKQALANVVVLYLRKKRLVGNERLHWAEEAARLRRETGLGAKNIHAALVSAGAGVARRFVERTLYEGRRTAPRVWREMPSFDEFKAAATKGLGVSGLVWDQVIGVEKGPRPGWVYDFTVNHPSHNFVAGGFLVSNCGVRLVRSNLSRKDVEGKEELLATALYNEVPSGLGVGGRLRLDDRELRRVLKDGAAWAVGRGMGSADDLAASEDGGRLAEADADGISSRALDRGRDQLGTLGSGNHFLELQSVDRVFDPAVAAAFGLAEGQVTVMVHTGSRGLGYQVCDDFLKVMQRAVQKYGIALPDRQLACAPLSSPEGGEYLRAMAAAANFARANRQVITDAVRRAFAVVLGLSDRDMGLDVVYDVCHNIGKVETHEVDGVLRRLCVHRKGATRAFPAGHPDVPEKYRSVGQPVLIPGTMGTASYVAVGTERAMKETFGTVCHGAGRRLSRSAASRRVNGRELAEELGRRGIVVRAASWKGLAEEAPEAYKDVEDVVGVCEGAGLSKKVARLKPWGVVKG